MKELATGYFAPVGGCGEPVGVRNGVYYTIDRPSARAVFPMHRGGRESAYADFAREAAAAGVRAAFHCAEFPGDHFTVRAPGGPRPARSEVVLSESAFSAFEGLSLPHQKDYVWC